MERGQQIGPDPGVIRYKSDGLLPRYKPHASRAFSKREKNEIEADDLSIQGKAIFVWIIVLVVIVILISIRNQKIIQTKTGFMGVAASLLFIISVMMWYLSSNTRTSLAYMIVLIIFLVLWWTLVEIFEFDHIPDVIAVTGIIIAISAFCYHQNPIIIIPIITFLILLYISNFDLKNNDI